MIQFRHYALLQRVVPVVLQSQAGAVRAESKANKRNVCRATSRLASSQADERGLFGVPFYRLPGDFKRAADTAKLLGPSFVNRLEQRQCCSEDNVSEENARRIAARYVSWLHEMDGLSNLLCQVLDAAEACRNCHADLAWQSDASEAYELLCTYMYVLNTCRTLYDAMVEVTDAPAAVMQHMTREQKQVAVLIRREFEKEGIHLPDDARAKLVELTQDAQSAAQEFTANAFEDVATFEVSQARIWLMCISS
jgi:Zn-dependent oligopeptidase